jgi:hypothetical protein
MMEPLWTASDDSDTAPQHARYALPIAPFSAISPAFVARLIKGCRGDGRADPFNSEKSSTINALTSISVAMAPPGRFFCGNRRAKCPS